MSKAVTLIDRDLGYKKLVRMFRNVKPAIAKVGMFGNSSDVSKNNAAKAAIHEYGTSKRNIPSRPFARNAFDNNVNVLTRQTNKLLKRGTRLKGIPRNFGVFVVTAVGHTMKKLMKKEILTGSFAALKPATIARKGHSKPLIDKGNMSKSIKVKVGNRNV